MSLAETVSEIGTLCEDERQSIELCNEFSEASEWRADEREQYGAEHSQVYADVLRECAESCRNLMAS